MRKFSSLGPVRCATMTSKSRQTRHRTSGTLDTNSTDGWVWQWASFSFTLRTSTSWETATSRQVWFWESVSRCSFSPYWVFLYLFYRSNRGPISKYTMEWYVSISVSVYRSGTVKTCSSKKLRMRAQTSNIWMFSYLTFSPARSKSSFLGSTSSLTSRTSSTSFSRVQLA